MGQKRRLGLGGGATLMPRRLRYCTPSLSPLPFRGKIVPRPLLLRPVPSCFAPSPLASPCPPLTSSLSPRPLSASPPCPLTSPIPVKDASLTQTYSFLPASWAGDTHEETDFLPISDREEEEYLNRRTDSFNDDASTYGKVLADGSRGVEARRLDCSATSKGELA